MLNLERLRVLHAVATTGSVVGAAGVLHVTTSAVSQQLARLERESGQTLLERQGRGIRLTPAGLLLAGHAGDLLSHVERVESSLAEHRGAVTGPLAVAAFATAARGLLPAALRDLRDRHPGLTATLSELDPHEALPALRRGLIDVAVVQDWAEDALAVPDGVSRLDLLQDRFDVALPATHPLADRPALSPADLVGLAGEGWISWSSGQICHDWLLSTLRALGTTPRIAHTAAEHATQIALVAAGLGTAVIPRLGRDPAPPSVRYVPVDPPPLRRVFALWRTDTSARPAITAALTALQTAAGALP